MPAPTWADAVEFCRVLARADVRARRAVRPTILGFEGDAFLGMVELRPHDDGEYREPIVEALALLVPLGADRIVFLGSGRVWSLEDPIPPVTRDADLRQSVAVVVSVDRHERPDPTMTSVLFPFDRLQSGLVVWREPVEIDEEGDGRIPTILRLIVGEGDRYPYDELTVGRQALRLLRLGHDLCLPDGEAAHPRLARCLATALDSELSGEPQPPWSLAQSWS